jgi:protoporphyrinogen oxidase
MEENNVAKTIETDTLIVGAGPAGLACAMELYKAGKDFVIVEKEKSPGGLAKTYEFKEADGLIFYTDNGPHRFFSKNKYLYDFIEDLIGEKWIKVKRQTRQYIDGVFYDYPINALQALKNIGFTRALKMILDYTLAKIEFGLFRKPVTSFKDYAYANFGKSLAEFNMVNYTEKIWGIPADTIHTDFAAQRIKGLSLTSVATTMIKRALRIGNSSPKSLVDEFYYPSRGTGFIYESIVSRIKKNGHIVLFETFPVKINMSDTKRNEVIVRDNKGDTTKILCRNLVESIPITKFVSLIEPTVPSDVNESVSKLKHRAQVYLFITLNKESITDDQWIYFPSKKTPIGRVSEMRNFSQEMSPKGKTSLFVEFFCFEGDDIWNAPKEKLLDYTLNAVKDLGVKMEEIRQTYVIRKNDVYPVYDLWYEDHLKKIKSYLDNFHNLYYIGRPGRFRYNNQDHSLEMGILAARCIMDGKRYDFDSVGSEREYFESGSIPEKK